MKAKADIVEPGTNVHPLERSAQRIWTAGIVGFFLLQAVLWVCAIALTAGDRSFAVIENYEQRADHWDQWAQLRRQSHQLGWQIHWTQPAADSSPEGLTMELVDQTGNPVRGAAFELTVFHCGQASRKQHVTAVEVEPGVYRATPRIDRAGRWKIEGRATRDNAVFLIDQIQVMEPVRGEP